ncbi:hypothetical protein Tco_1392281 [Tanacetum coccineum]
MQRDTTREVVVVFLMDLYLLPPSFVNPDNEKAKETEVTKDQVQPTRVQPPVVQIKEKVQNKEKVPVVEPRVVNEPVKTKTNLPYPSRVEKDKNRERDDILASNFHRNLSRSSI